MNEAHQTAEEVMAPYRFLIESALDFSGDTHDYADIVEGVKNMTMFFWPAEKSEIKGMEPSLQEFAKNLKCDAISLTGRNGWKRTLNDMGYKPAHITMVREL